jgi:hypothetical protein
MLEISVFISMGKSLIFFYFLEEAQKEQEPDIIQEE